MNADQQRFLRHQFPAILWAAVIFAASSIPGTQLPKIALSIPDKIIHATIFFIFGILVYNALEPKIKIVAFHWKRVFIAVAAVILYGLLDEFHQSFVPGRTVDILDATADAIGGLLAATVIYIGHRIGFSKTK